MYILHRRTVEAESQFSFITVESSLGGSAGSWSEVGGGTGVTCPLSETFLPCGRLL